MYTDYSWSINEKLSIDDAPPRMLPWSPARFLLIHYPTSMNQATSSIVLLARLTRWATAAAIVCGAALWLWASVAWFGDAAPVRVGAMVAGGFAPPGDPAQALYAAFPVSGWALGSLGLAVTGYGLVRLIQLMRIYESGVVFDPRAATLLSSFAAALFLRALIDILAPTVLSCAAHLGDGHTPIFFAVRSGQAHVLFITLVFLLIARIMAVGHRLADDNAKII